jgi:hypothetical protein
MSSPPITLSQTGVGRSRVHVPDTYISPFAIGVGCIVTGTVTYNIEHTFDDTLSATYNAAAGAWFVNTGISAATANANGNYAYPVNGISINITAGTGSVTAYLLQAGTR